MPSYPSRSPTANGQATVYEWERLRERLVLAALALTPLSYTIKLVYHLPFAWVDPSLVLGAAAAVLPGWALYAANARMRRVALYAAIFLGIYWLAAATAVTSARFAGAELFREPIRTTLGVLLCIACIRALHTPAALRRGALVLSWVGVVEVILAVYLLVGLALNFPMPAAWRDYQAHYWIRQSIYAGRIVWPRLGGTFVEAPPYGLYILGVLIVLGLGRRAARQNGMHMPGAWLDAILWVGLVGSLSTQVLAGAVLWGIAVAAERLTAPVVRARVRWWYGAAACALVVVLASGAYLKYAKGRNEVNGRGSVGERSAHAAIAWRIFQNDPLLGMGPGQYGQVAMRESYGLYETTSSPQFIAPELLAETGVLGTTAAVLLVACVLWVFVSRRDYWSTGAAIALIFADGFQANWRWPILFIAFGTLLVAPLAVRPAEGGSSRT